MDFIKCLNSLRTISQASLKDAPHPSVEPAPQKAKDEAPIYHPVSITTQVERFRLNLIAKSKTDNH